MTLSQKQGILISTLAALKGANLRGETSMTINRAAMEVGLCKSNEEAWDIFSDVFGYYFFDSLPLSEMGLLQRIIKIEKRLAEVQVKMDLVNLAIIIAAMVFGNIIMLLWS